MKNKPLAAKLLAKIKEFRSEHSTNNNSIFSLQRQVSSLFDLIELTISDEDVSLNQSFSQPQGGYPQGGYPQGGYPQAARGIFSATDRPPTVEEAETMDIPPTNSAQFYMTARGTKVIPPAYLNMAPFMIQPGDPTPNFPSLQEHQRSLRGPAPVAHPPGYQINPSYQPGYAGYSPSYADGASYSAPGAPLGYVPPPGYALIAVGTPSNPTTPGQHPAGAPPGLQSASMPAVGHAVAESMPLAPVNPASTPSSVHLGKVGIPESLAHMVQDREMITEQPPQNGGARNITNSDGSLPGQPRNMYPGGQVVTG